MHGRTQCAGCEEECDEDSLTAYRRGVRLCSSCLVCPHGRALVGLTHFDSCEKCYVQAHVIAAPATGGVFIYGMQAWSAHVDKDPDPSAASSIRTETLREFTLMYALLTAKPESMSTQPGLWRRETERRSANHPAFSGPYRGRLPPHIERWRWLVKVRNAIKLAR